MQHSFNIALAVQRKREREREKNSNVIKALITKSKLLFFHCSLEKKYEIKS